MPGPPPGQGPGRRPGLQQARGPEENGRRNPGLFNVPESDDDDEDDREDAHSWVSHMKSTLERASTDVEIAGSFKARRPWDCELSWSSRLSRTGHS